MKLATGQNLMFVRTAYMSEYKGITKNDKPYSGSSYLEDSQLINEANNFKAYQNICYGFFMIQGNLNLKRLGGSPEDDFVDDILVIIVASSPKKGSVIIGWYDHARVYKKPQKLPEELQKKRRKLYNMKAETKDCFLVPERERIKLFPDNFSTKMRRNFNWYAEEEEDQRIVKRTINFIESKTIKNTDSKKRGLWKNIEK
ncbi:MAG: hypothetical protein ACQEQD_06155 [Bacillota bacterium]